MTLVERLREPMARDEFFKVADQLCKDAADRIDELEAALDAKEIESGLTRNGNLWRFWSTKARDLAVKNATLEAELSKAREAALEEAAKVAEGLAPFSQASIASASSSALLDNEASVTRSIFARRVAAAIRSLSHKEG